MKKRGPEIIVSLSTLFLSLLIHSLQPRWVMAGMLLTKAVERLAMPHEVDGQTMLIIAVLGLCVNICMMVTLGHGHSHGGADAHKHEHNLALKAAIIHVMGDILQSVGVIVAAGLIYWQPFDVGTTHTGISNWNYADPIITIGFDALRGDMKTYYGAKLAERNMHFHVSLHERNMLFRIPF